MSLKDWLLKCGIISPEIFQQYQQASIIFILFSFLNNY